MWRPRSCGCGSWRVFGRQPGIWLARASLSPECLSSCWEPGQGDALPRVASRVSAPTHSATEPDAVVQYGAVSAPCGFGARFPMPFSACDAQKVPMSSPMPPDRREWDLSSWVYLACRNNGKPSSAWADSAVLRISPPMQSARVPRPCCDGGWAVTPARWAGSGFLTSC